MARRNVQHGGIDYLVNEDDVLAPDRRWWAVMRTRVIDELTGEPPRTALTLSTTTPRCTPRVDGNGNCGLVARPGDVATALTTVGALTAEIQAQGFLTRSLTGAIDAARRQLSPGGALAGTTLLQVTPVDPVPAPPGEREQFRPGRGVMLARPPPLNLNTEEFTTVATPLAVPAANQVPLVDAVAVARPANTRVAGVPIVLPDQPLHHAPVVAIRGRVMLQAAAGASAIPAPAAHIHVAGLWWSLPEVRANSAPPHAPNVVAMESEVAFEHAAGTSLEHCTLTPDLVSRALASTAHRGAREIQLANWSAINLAGGQVLQLEADPSGERELVVLDAFTPPSLPANPARIPLRTPLATAHAAGTPASLMAVTVDANTTLAREAQPGDRVLFAVNLPLPPAPAPAVTVLRLAAATPAEELCFARRVPTLNGATVEFPIAIQLDGTFEFPALGRIAQLRIRATHPAQTGAENDLALDYGGDNTLEILLKP